MAMIDKTYLKQLHTKQMLKVLQGVRARDARLYGNIPPDKSYVNPIYHLGLCGDGTPCTITLADLYEELATRPHVPNKIESKQIRKEKHARGKNKGRKDKLCQLHTHLSGHVQMQRDCKIKRLR